MAQSKADEFAQPFILLARYAKALSHPARLAILTTLAQRATCICGEIVEVLPLAQSTVSQHLKELKDAGLISGEVDGPKSCYCLNVEAVRELEKLVGSLLKDLNKGLRARNKMTPATLGEALARLKEMRGEMRPHCSSATVPAHSAPHLLEPNQVSSHIGRTHFVTRSK